MADWLNPQIGTQYISFLDYLKARDEDAAKLFDNTGTNLPIGTIKWSSGNNRFEKFDGTNWSELTTQYNINVTSVNGASVDDASTTSTALWTASKIISELNGKANTSLNNVSDSTILTKLKNVDGAGSGLDADLLDGLQSNEFVRKSTDNGMDGTLTWNTPFTGGWGGLTGNAAINVGNGNITSLNALVFNDLSNNAQEGIIFPIADGATSLSQYTTLNIGVDRELYIYPDSSQTTKHKFYHTGNDNNLAKLDTVNTFTAVPQRIKSNTNDIGYLDGIRQDGTRQYLIGATGSTTPLDLRAYDVDGSTIIGRVYCTDIGNVAITPKSGSGNTYIHSDLFVYPNNGTIRILNSAGQGSYLWGRAADGASRGWHVGRAAPTTNNLYLYNYVAGANIYLNTNGGKVYANNSEVWHAGNDGFNSGLEPDVATSTRIGGMKVRFDSNTKILYLRTDGTDA